MEAPSNSFPSQIRILSYAGWVSALPAGIDQMVSTHAAEYYYVNHVILIPPDPLLSPGPSEPIGKKRKARLCIKIFGKPE